MNAIDREKNRICWPLARVVDNFHQTRNQHGRYRGRRDSRQLKNKSETTWKLYTMNGKIWIRQNLNVNTLFDDWMVMRAMSNKSCSVYDKKPPSGCVDYLNWNWHWIGFALDVAECIHFDQSKSFLSFSYAQSTWGEPNKTLLFTAPLHTATRR